MVKGSQKPGNKAVALLTVLMTLLVLVIISNIALNVVASQSRLSHHQVSRIQAEYAAWAGVNLAREMFRSQNASWPFPGPTYRRTICNGCPLGPGDINEPSLPRQIRNITITVAPAAACPGAPAGTQICINSTAHYN